MIRNAKALKSSGKTKEHVKFNWLDFNTNDNNEDLCKYFKLIRNPMHKLIKA